MKLVRIFKNIFRNLSFTLSNIGKPAVTIKYPEERRVFPDFADKNEETLELPIMVAALTQPGKKDYTLPHSFDYRSKDLSLITLPSSSLLEIWFNSLNVEFKKLDWSFYSSRSCTYQDLLTPDQKFSSHWADVYKSGIRVSYVLSK